MGIELLNLRQVQNAMLDFSEKDVRSISKTAIRKSGNRLKTRVKQEVPVERGNLKKSIHVSMRSTKNKEPYAYVKTKLGYYNTLLYGERTNQYGTHEVSNPTGNWYDATVEKYGAESVQMITKELKNGMRKSAAKNYAKTLVRTSKVVK